ncbi:MAG: hypothetical protein RIM83_10415 [Allomuricauda sp.]
MEKYVDHQFLSDHQRVDFVQGLILFNVGQGFDIGYAYENATERPVNGIDNATHELFMRLAL